MTAPPARDRVLDEVAAHLDNTAARRTHPVRVGIDGVCGVGKTTFAAELAERLAGRGRPVVVVDSDGFHHVRARRHRQPDPARGYYEDAYDLDALADRVLRPLGPGGSRRYAVRVHDLVTDAVVDDEVATAPVGAVVLVAATFLHSPVLDGLWDETVFLAADEGIALRRGVARDAEALGGAEAARAAYETRYLAACRLYLAERDPASRSTVVVEHDDVAAPRVVRLGPGWDS